MSYRTILLHVEPTEASDARLAAAVGLARQWSAALIGVGGCEPAFLDNPLISAFGDGMAVDACMQVEARELAEAETRFQTAVQALGPAAAWRSDPRYPDLALQAAAAAADIVVAGAAAGPKVSTVRAVELVLQAGAPVLILPPGVAQVATRRILVAWKNTRESRRAVTDALPMLKEAEAVTLASVVDGDPAADSEAAGSLRDVSERLGRHGVTASVETLKASEAAAGHTLLAFAQARGFDLIVAGAYGHSRAQEWLLGGVTQTFLEETPLPILFSR